MSGAQGFFEGNPLDFAEFLLIFLRMQKIQAAARGLASRRRLFVIRRAVSHVRIIKAGCRTH